MGFLWMNAAQGDPSDGIGVGDDRTGRRDACSIGRDIENCRIATWTQATPFLSKSYAIRGCEPSPKYSALARGDYTRYEWRRSQTRANRFC
ncbi:MAG: hypothetical protein ABI846_15270, partial [Rudaea sp.]